eukprot:scaffold103705_cov62-Phaeocystis_antarctica.AAC.4
MGNQEGKLPQKPKGEPASATTNARAAVPALAPAAVSVPAVLPALEVEVPAAVVPEAAGSAAEAQQAAPSAVANAQPAVPAPAVVPAPEVEVPAAVVPEAAVVLEPEAKAEKVAKAEKAGPARLLGDVKGISDEEVRNFKRIAQYMRPNPRSIKRVTAIYRLSRLIVRQRCASWKGGEEKELLRRLLVWVVLCEQWPVHIAWSLQVLEDLQQRRHLHKPGELSDLVNPSKLSFHEFYHEHVKQYVFNVEQSHCPVLLRQRYQRVFALEYDKELFDSLIADGLDASFELKVEHIGKLQSRDAKKLISYCTNLNPALTSLLGLMKAVPQSQEVEKTVKKLVDDSSELKHFPRSSAESTTAKGDGGEGKAAAAAAAAAAAESEAGGEAKAKTGTKVKAEAETEAEAEVTKRKTTVNMPKDDKTGKDHIGYADYALCLSSLIFGALETPCVIGIYAQWGTGKSFIMEKIKVALKALQLEQTLLDLVTSIDAEQTIVVDTGIPIILKAGEYVDDLSELLKHDEEQISLMFDWVQMEMPQLPHEAFLDDDGNVAVCKPRCTSGEKPATLVRLNPGYFARRKTADLQLDTTALWLLVLLLIRIITFVCKPIIWVGNAYRHCVCTPPEVDPKLACTLYWLMEAGKKHRLKHLSPFERKWKLFLRYLFSHKLQMKDKKTSGSNSASESHDTTDNKDKGEQTTISKDYHYIWWNAWLYSGSDNLWAGLIKALHEAVEERYGAPYARARRDAMMISVGVQCVLAACLMALAVAFTVEQFHDFSFAVDGLIRSVGPIVASLIAAASSVCLSISSIKQWLRTPVSDSARIVEEVASGAIQQKLGFMHLIKNELDKIGAMLQDPESTIPSFLDYLLPAFLLHGHLHTALARLCGVSQPNMQPCRMVIIVDDLDRCPGVKVMEVLQSLVLLTEGTPFVIFLAIDQRVVVAAIEKSGEGIYSDAGINGNEYLDKIVQIPFVIPQLADDEKANLCQGYLRPALAQKARRAAYNQKKQKAALCGIQDTKPWEHPPLKQLSMEPANRQRESTMERTLAKLVDGQPDTKAYITSAFTDASHALSGPGSKFMVLKIDADEDAAKITGISLSLMDKDPLPGPYGPYTVRFVGRQILRWSITPTDASITVVTMEALASGESIWHFTNWSGVCKLEVDFKPSSEKSLCIEWFNGNQSKHFPLDDVKRDSVHKVVTSLGVSTVLGQWQSRNLNVATRLRVWSPGGGTVFAHVAPQREPCREWGQGAASPRQQAKGQLELGESS